MGSPELAMRFEDLPALQAEFVTNLQHGRAFLPTPTPLEVLQPCALVLEHPESGTRLSLEAQVVMVTPAGVGIELRPHDAGVICAIERFVQGGAPETSAPPPLSSRPAPPAKATAPARPSARPVPTAARVDMNSVAAPLSAAPEDLEPESEPEVEEGLEESAGAEPFGDLQAVTRIQELRNLTQPAQQKLARTGELSDRVQLERLYGKSVWEGLLENPRITVPEIARISRKGTVPRILLDHIIDNRQWINQTPVRRALLGNPRVSPEGVLKLLRATPRHELKTINKGTAYTAFIREQARKLLLDPGR